MASSSNAVNDSVILTEYDIPGASLAGLKPSSLKNRRVHALECITDNQGKMERNSKVCKFWFFFIFQNTR